MSLYISSTTASSGLTDSPINQAISQLAAAVAMAKREGRIPEGPSLDVTFMLPGQFDKPDFSGMRMGGYGDDSDTLFFERPVPEYIIHSDMAQEYVTIVMQDVIDHAGDFFQENKIAFESTQWRQLLQSIAQTGIELGETMVDISGQDNNGVIE